MRYSSIQACALALVAAGCSFNPPPAPVLAEGEEFSALVGVWSGEYSSEDTGRSGEILFHLSEGARRAYGGALMIPVGSEPHRHADGVHPGSEYVYVSFVRIRGTRVQGQLDQYRDPACGCRVMTTFEGELDGDTIRGSFSTLHLGDGTVQRGRWSASRTGESAAHI